MKEKIYAGELKEKDKHAIAKELLYIRSENIMKNTVIKPLTKKQLSEIVVNVNPKEELKTMSKMFKQAQDTRIVLENCARSGIVNQIPDVYEDYDPNKITGDALIYMYTNAKATEETIKRLISDMTSEIPICRWMESLPGIGPAHSSQLYSIIDIHQAPTAGHIWSFAGIDVGGKRLKKGQKINWNPALKARCYLISDSFIKAKNNSKNIYARLYEAKKEEYINRNETGGMAKNAAEQLELAKNKKISKELIELYESGKISKLHIENMARRYMVKIFLSHLQHVWYRLEFNEMPPKPFAIAHLGHAHEIKIPNLNVVGLD